MDVEAAAGDDERGGRAADEPSFERRREAEDDEKVGVRRKPHETARDGRPGRRSYIATSSNIKYKVVPSTEVVLS